MPRVLSEQHKKAMLAGRRKKAAQRARQEARMQATARKEELKLLKASLPRLRREYDKAYKVALAATKPEDITKKWNRADQAQDAILATCRRIRALEDEHAA
jgi:hypothetical protein